jgi:hypothetical protein
MRNFHFLAILSFVSIVVSCDDDDDTAPYVDPRYAEMADVSEVTATGATFALKLKRPVTKTTDGYLVDEMYFDEYSFFYSTDPDQSMRFWQQADGKVADASGTYSLTVSDLKPGTRYYVKAMVIIAPHAQQMYLWSVSASVLEFETLQ